jgi:hypothetical protein
MPARRFRGEVQLDYQGRVHRHHFRIRAEARLKIATWVVDYNTRQRRGACDGMSPIKLRAIHGPEAWSVIQNLIDRCKCDAE